MVTARSFVVVLVLVVEKRAQVPIGADDDGATSAAVPAIRPPLGDEFFPPETYASDSTVACFELDLCDINKLHKWVLSSSWTKRRRTISVNSTTSGA